VCLSAVQLLVLLALCVVCRVQHRNCDQSSVLCHVNVTFIEPSHSVCKPAYLVPVPNQDKVGGLQQDGHLA